MGREWGVAGEDEAELSGLSFWGDEEAARTKAAAAFWPPKLRFRAVADLMVNSFFDAATEEVAAFEELVGSHGGLGGPQSHPLFVACPTGYGRRPPRPIAVHLAFYAPKGIYA